MMDSDSDSENAPLHTQFVDVEDQIDRWTSMELPRPGPTMAQPKSTQHKTGTDRSPRQSGDSEGGTTIADKTARQMQPPRTPMALIQSAAGTSAQAKAAEEKASGAGISSRTMTDEDLEELDEQLEVIRRLQGSTAHKPTPAKDEENLHHRLQRLRDEDLAMSMALDHTSPARARSSEASKQKEIEKTSFSIQASKAFGVSKASTEANVGDGEK